MSTSNAAQINADEIRVKFAGFGATVALGEHLDSQGLENAAAGRPITVISSSNPQRLKLSVPYTHTHAFILRVRWLFRTRDRE